MTAIAKIDLDKWLRLQRLLIAFRFASVLAALMLFTAVPSHAWTYYSGASVGTDGTVYGWGVTDVTASGMNHRAYVTTTLTSPVKHRQAYQSGNAQNSVREDVSLPFDPNDLGNYLEASSSSGYCYAINGWILQNAQSQASGLLRMTQYAALRYDTLTTDICGYTSRERTYQGLDIYGWIPNNEYWILNETLTSKDQSCGTINLGGNNGFAVGFSDVIDIGCANPKTCVFQTDQTFSVAPVKGQPLTQVPGKDCVGITNAAQCYAQPPHTGWHVMATASSITVTDN